MATWTAIPTDFGSGGKGLSPSGSHGTPALYTLLAEIQALIPKVNPEEISASGALSVTKTSRLTVSGSLALTLADGIVDGSRKRIFCVSAAATPHGVVTPAHGSGFTTIDFTTANGWVDLEFDTSLGTPAWKIVGIAGTVVVT